MAFQLKLDPDLLRAAPAHTAPSTASVVQPREVYTAAARPDPAAPQRKARAMNRPFRQCLYLIAPVLAAQTPLAEVLAVVRQQPIAVLAYPGERALDPYASRLSRRDWG
jgi:hypothetical protein